MRKRFHHCHQLNTMDCGPACLQMVARHYGRYYRLETLREKCFITREGVSMLGISDAAESIGMRSTGVRTGLKELRERAPLPCVLHWRNMHFVVLYRIRKGRKGWLYDIADPASQLVTYKEPEFLDCWKSAVDSSLLRHHHNTPLPVCVYWGWHTVIHKIIGKGVLKGIFLTRPDFSPPFPLPFSK